MQVDRPDQAAAVESLFRRLFWVIEEGLVTYYQIAGQEAVALAQSLFVWFDRFSRRGGVYLDVEDLRLFLLVGTCKSAHSYCLLQLNGAPAPNEQLKGVLEKGPYEIATELEKKWRQRELEEREKR